MNKARRSWLWSFLLIVSVVGFGEEEVRFKELHSRSDVDAGVLAAENSDNFFVAAKTRIEEDSDAELVWLYSVNKTDGTVGWETIVPGYDKSSPKKLVASKDGKDIFLFFSSRGEQNWDRGEELFFTTLDAKTGAIKKNQHFGFADKGYFATIKSIEVSSSEILVAGDEREFEEVGGTSVAALKARSWFVILDLAGEVKVPKVKIDDAFNNVELVTASKWNPEKVILILNKSWRKPKDVSGHLRAPDERLSAEIRLVDFTDKKVGDWVAKINSPTDKQQFQVDLATRVTGGGEISFVMSGTTGRPEAEYEDGISYYRLDYSERQKWMLGVKANQTNTVVWKRSYTTNYTVSSIEIDYDTSNAQEKEHEFVIAGSYRPSYSVDPFYVSKFSLEDGKQIWSRDLTYNKFETSSYASHAIPTLDGLGVFAVGTSTTRSRPEEDVLSHSYYTKMDQFGLTFRGIGSNAAADDSEE